MTKYEVYVYLQKLLHILRCGSKKDVHTQETKREKPSLFIYTLLHTKIKTFILFLKNV